MLKIFHLPPGLLLLSAVVAANQLPYNPTRILRSPRNDHLVYVFRPSSDSSFELSSIDTSVQLSPDDFRATLLCSNLPFLTGQTSTAFTPAIDESGAITVYAGKCGKGNTGAELWKFTPTDSEESGNGNGTWTKETMSDNDTSSDSLLNGANYLASGLSFSSVLGGDSDFYSFGGMCPFNDQFQQYDAGPESWQSSANYSNLLLSLTRDSNDAASTTNPFTMSVTPTGSKPIAEAGFSITGLAPTYSNDSDSSRTQQQSFIMIGGHTESAFINMSQVALFSLPQGAWNFLPIDQPTGGHTDLTVRHPSAEVEPRSGHSAVLSSDGNTLIVFGGWIGNVNTPATPQLAVLNIGEGYGGSGSWSWTVPRQSGSAPANMYGHDALMLDGDVMMVLGGYTVAVQSSKFRRGDGQQQNLKAYFFNVSSSSWVPSYQPPNDSVQAADTAGSGLLSTTSQKAGLGVGLGIGIIAVIALLVFYLWYRRRLQQKRAVREEEIRKLSYGAHRITTGDPFGGNVVPGAGYYGDGPYSEKRIASPNPSVDQQGWRSGNGHDAERTGLLLDIPSPTRGLRRSLGIRNAYLPAPRYDDRRLSNIQTIEESDEEHVTGALHQKNRSEAPSSIASNTTTLDPFSDHRPLSSHPVGPSCSPTEAFNQSTNPQRAVVRGNAKEMEQVAAYLKENAGRISPSKSDDRTSSTLSDSTARSGLTAHSNGASATLVGSLARNLSIHSSGLLNALGLGATIVNPFTTPDSSPTQEQSSQDIPDTTVESTQRPRRGSHSSNCRPSTKGSEHTGSSSAEAESFYSAHSRNTAGFAKLQAESEALLGSHRPAGAIDGYDFASISYNNATPGASPARQDRYALRPGPSTITGNAMAVLGGVRRVLTSRRTNSDQRSASFTLRSPRFPTRPRSGTTTDLDNSSSSSPTKHRANGLGAAPPRRAASDAGFWKAKRGARDWNGEMEGWDDPDDDWDVEAAAERRNVQVMFTVPRERLRVVNADVDGRSLLSSVDGDEGGGEGPRVAKTM